MEYELCEEYKGLSKEDQKRRLFENQKDVLDKFLERGAISQAQYDKSLGDLKAKMGYGAVNQ